MRASFWCDFNGFQMENSIKFHFLNRQNFFRGNWISAVFISQLRANQCFWSNAWSGRQHKYYYYIKYYCVGCSVVRWLLQIIRNPNIALPGGVGKVLIGWRGSSLRWACLTLNFRWRKLRKEHLCAALRRFNSTSFRKLWRPVVVEGEGAGGR